MCRNIKTLFNYMPPATEEEIRAASVQFIRKISGSTKPSKVNEAAFKKAIDDVEATVRELLRNLVTSALPKDREMERQKALARSAQRFGTI
ncbi:MAG: DUF2277 domain-containing protein [Candidatus Latescibacterota bacterium]